MWGGESLVRAQRGGERVRVCGKVISEFVETASGQMEELPVPYGLCQPVF